MTMLMDEGRPRGESSSALIVAEEENQQQVPIITTAVKRTIPAWGRSINQAVAMPMITHQDKYHVHAASAALWFLGSYLLLFNGLAHEFGSDDWTPMLVGYSDHLLLLPLALSGLVMAATALPMLPNGRQFTNYASQMRHSMVSVALLATLAVSFTLPHDTEVVATTATADQLLQLSALWLTPPTAALGFLVLVWTAFQGRPWNVLPIMDELKIGQDLGAAIWATHVLSFAWVIQTLVVVAHGCLFNTPHMMMDAVVMSSTTTTMEQAFAVQMALSLAVTPASESFIAGTLMKNDRFNNKNERHWTLTEMNDGTGTLRVKRLTEAMQLLLVYSGPYLTIGAALAHGHWEVVQHFFFWDESLHGFAIPW